MKYYILYRKDGSIATYSKGRNIFESDIFTETLVDVPDPSVFPGAQYQLGNVIPAEDVSERQRLLDVIETATTLEDVKNAIKNIIDTL